MGSFLSALLGFWIVANLQQPSLSVSQELSFLFHQTRLVLSEMIFFIKQVQYFCHLEVIACSWQDFVKIILNEKGEGDLDSLINNHKIYLNRLVSKILLKSVATGGRSGKKNGVEVSCLFFLCGGLLC